jgi:hypothetical protein
MMINTSTTDKAVEVKVNNFRKGSRFFWYTLTGAGDNGEFSRKVIVNGETTTAAGGGPTNYKTIAPMSAFVAGGLRVTVPARAVVFMAIEKP